MSYFLPSIFQKRLLRYALSRLELVDTDALDLDSLGITWGQRSTFELKDIGLRLEKLASILHLPLSCDLTKARISLLRVTIPADIYSSGIFIEVEGAHIHLRLLSEDTAPCTEDDHQRRTCGLSKGVKADRPRSSRSEVHDPGGEHVVLPSTADLAQSFLESEPREEKAELQAVLSSQSQDLHSDVFSDDEEELGVGLHEGVSLPSFVAAFLKGVVDRLQLKIQDVTLRIDMELRQDENTKGSIDAVADPVTGLLTIQDVFIDGVASSVGENTASMANMRRTSFSQVHAMLVSEPGVFSHYSRFCMPSSSSTTSSKGSHNPLRIPSPAPHPSSGSGSSLAMTRSTVLESPPILETTPLHPLESSSYSADGRFSDAGTEDEYEGFLDDVQAIAENQYDENLLDNPAYLEEVLGSQFADDMEESSVLPINVMSATDRRGVDTSHPSSRPPPDPGADKSVRHLSGSAHLSTSTWPQIPETCATGNQAEIHEETRSKDCFPPKPSTPPRHESFGPRHDLSEIGLDHGFPSEDLSQSRLFTHEEAASMYLSAMSHASASASSASDMPGAWSSPKTASNKRDVDSHKFRPPEDSSESLSLGYTPDLANATAVPTAKAIPLESQSSNDTELGPSSHALGSRRFPFKSNSGDESEKFYTLPNRSQGVPEVAKKILDIDKITIWLPSSGKADDTSPIAAQGQHRSTADPMSDSVVSLSESVSRSGIYSAKSHLPHRPHQDPAASPPMDRIPLSRADDTTFEIPHGKQKTQPVEVDISAIAVKLDISSGWLLTKMGKRVMETWSRSKGEEELQVPNRPLPSLPLKVNIKSCSFRFLEHLPGQVHHSNIASSSSLSQTFSSIDDSILRMTLSGIGFHSSVCRSTLKLHLNISKAAFGHASEDILTFDKGLKMRDSTRDVLSPTHGDISLSVSKSAESANVTLTTLPARLLLNLQRLDDTLSWLGGLSTILELGSSVGSTSTIKAGKTNAIQRPRGVHFESMPAATPIVTQTNPIPWKINSRIGGIVVTLAGERGSIELKTTAVKIVSRFGGIVVQIDKGKLSGPHTVNDVDTSGKVNLENIRVKYLFAPKEEDLDRLLSLLTPSKDKYDEDDDIMLDTLFRQRRQGAVLHVTIDSVKATVSALDSLMPLSYLGNEMAKLSNVTKYLPQDDRPGILTLALVRELEAEVGIGGPIGDIKVISRITEAAHVSIPSLMAARISTITVTRNGAEELVGEAIDLHADKLSTQPPLPMIMARFIADEMEPTLKFKLYNLRVEYTVPSIIALLGLGDDISAEDMAANMANSVVNLAELHNYQQDNALPSIQSSVSSDNSKTSFTPSKMAIVLRDCLIGLNPRETPAKGVVVFGHARFSTAVQQGEPAQAILEIQRASIMIIDDVEKISRDHDVHNRRTNNLQSDQVQNLSDMGYVPVCSISSAVATVKVMQLDVGGEKSLDVELKDDLLILETCADSTQTLIAILNGLIPPTPPSTALKYRTEVVPIQDMLTSFSGDAFTTNPVSFSNNLSEPVNVEHVDHDNYDPAEELEYISDFYPSIPDYGQGKLSSRAGYADGWSSKLLDSFHSDAQVSSNVSGLDFQDDHFAKKSAVGGTAHRWDSSHNTYGLANDVKLHDSPVRVRIRDVHVIWNLFDGYDWQRTRDSISKAVKDVQAKATERRARAANRFSQGLEDDEESVIGDFLFNSIYIGIPSNRDPRDLSHDINRNIDDLASETGSYTTSTTVTGTSPRTPQSPTVKGKRLRLGRSKQHKMTFELKGISADLVVFPPGSGETQSSLDIRIADLEIFDHVPTSTWKKFATYMHDAGERETGTSMIHLEILNVKPVAELAASEIVLKATILPLRLHVDQDALDFMSRFFEFKDESMPIAASRNEQPFLQRVEVNAVRVRLDFKPKRVDYGGLRSGRTTEFMNFFVLDEADMVLRHVIIYGVSGFEKLGKTLNDIWMPDIKSNQLPGILAGLAPIKSLVNVGSGVKDLVVIPMREYKKDGRIVRSIQKGALAFAKTTTSELVKLGAKLAIGTQTALQSAEDFLNYPGGLSPQHAAATPDVRLGGASIDGDEKKHISLYADQPVGVVQGLRGAYASLERDLIMARDAIVAVPGEILESGSAGQAAKAVWRRAPTVILRPAIGASKAVGQTLLGAGNSLDPTNRRRVEDKYKRH